MGEIENDVAEVESLIPAKGTALAVFGSTVKIDELLDLVVAAARAKLPAAPDMAKTKDRDAVRHAARFIGSSFQALDKARLDLTADMRAAVARVNDGGDRIKTKLRAEQAAIRAPLAAWEEAEKQRLEALADRLADLATPRIAVHTATTAELADEIRRVQAIKIDESWQEKTAQAGMTKDKALADLRRMWAFAEQRERDAADLARLRAEQSKRDAEEAERKQLEDERLAAEAAERKRQEDEARAAAERQRIADEAAARATAEAEEKIRKAAAKAAAELAEAERLRVEAERQAIAAEARVAENAKAAVEAERQRVAAAAETQRAADAKAAANKARRARNRADMVADLEVAMAAKDYVPAEKLRRLAAELAADAILAGTVRHVEYRP